MWGKIDSLISAVAFQRLPKLAFWAPQASMPRAALHQPPYTSVDGSTNWAPVRGSLPTIVVGMPVLYVWGTALSGSTSCMATAITSPMSAPGWWVPAETGWLAWGLRTQPGGGMSSMDSENPSFFG